MVQFLYNAKAREDTNFSDSAEIKMAERKLLGIAKREVFMSERSDFKTL